MGGARGLAVVIAFFALLAPAASAQTDPDPPDADVGHPENAITKRVDRYQPKPAGTTEKIRLWFGPYTVLPGHDGNRFDVDIPLRNGFLVSVEPTLRRAADLKIPSRQEAHIHHAHWFRVEPGNQEDTYLQGNGEWIYGTGDEETKADFSERSAADPKGPIYGQYLNATDPQLMIYMLHNKTNQPRLDYIALDVTFTHGPPDLKTEDGRPYHDISGALFGRTFDVPRNPVGDGIFSTTRDSPKGPIEWVSETDGMLIGTGSHLHPGGLNVLVENFGSEEKPCPDDGKGTGGTMLLDASARWRDGVQFSEDFQMEVTHPAWRAPIRKGDRLRITGQYSNLDNAWYTTMTHQGLYIDKAQKPEGECAPKLIADQMRRKKITRRVLVTVRKRVKGAVKVVQRYKTKTTFKKVKRNPIAGVITKSWPASRKDPTCGPPYAACEKEERTLTPAPAPNNTVTIGDFLYVPGDQSLSGALGAPPLVQKGHQLTFVNADEALGIRHSVTTCPWPCNGTYVANYPFGDGVWDSQTLGYDVIDGGNPNPVAHTPPDLNTGKYAYYCRIHPWMRGSFEVTQ